jgi:hypothetical protein
VANINAMAKKKEWALAAHFAEQWTPQGPLMLIEKLIEANELWLAKEYVEQFGLQVRRIRRSFLSRSPFCPALSS